MVCFSVQGKKRFDMDAPVGPFGTKVSAFCLHFLGRVSNWDH